MAEPRFLFLGADGWPAGRMQNLWVSPAGTLRLQPLSAAAPAALAATAEPAADLDVTGIALAPDGRQYLLDTARSRILVRQGDRTAPVPCVGGCGSRPGQLQQPRGLDVGPRHTLYVADTDNDRVQLFSLRNFQVVGIWTGLARPWDVAAAPAGDRIYVTEAGARRIRVLDPDGQTLLTMGEGVLQQPRGLALDAAGRLYVADVGLQCVVAYTPDGTEAARYRTFRQAAAAFAPVAVAASGPWIWAADGVGRRVEQFSLDGGYAGTCRGWRGPVTGLAADAAGRLLVATGTGQPIRFEPAAGAAISGEFLSGPLDSSLIDCQWHKVALQVRVPALTTLKVETHTAPVIQQPGELDDAGWSPPVTFTGPADGLLDLAVLSPPGRYLWLRLTMAGPGTDSPEVDWLRAYYPRTTYLQYLPGVYQEDPVSADFLHRFMLLIEHFYGGWESKLDDLPRLFNPLAADAAALPWLASWLAFTLEERWPEEKRRQVLLRAIALYQRRGTPTGLADFLHLHTRHRPRIVEGWTRRARYRLACADGSRRQSCATVLPVPGTLPAGGAAGGGPAAGAGAYQFAIYTYQYPGQPADEVARLNRTATAERPAHTVHHLHEVTPTLRVGMQSIVGLDTVLAAGYPPARAGDGAPLGQGRLPDEAPAEPAAQLVRRGPVLDSGDRIR